jgi:hypothetical protein
VLRRKLLLFVILAFAVLSLVSYFTMIQFGLFSGSAPLVTLSPTITPSAVPVTSETNPTLSPPYSTKSIVRNANTLDEKKALQLAEDFDYANATNTALYTDGYANYINTNVIDYYSCLTDSSIRGIILNYEASSSIWSEAKVTLTGYSLQISSPTNGVVSIDKIGLGTFAYLNGSKYQLVQEPPAVSFDLPSCYVVKMDLAASEILGPTSGFFTTIRQIVILDNSFRPVAFGTKLEQAVS